MRARWRFTDRRHGDLAPGQPDVETRRSSLVGRPWTWLAQEHGARVVVVEHPGEHAGATADAAVSAIGGAVLSVAVADCAPIVLVGSTGGQTEAIGVAHAGWRGLTAGVVEAAVVAVAALGPLDVFAVVGPCIGPECYEFGADDLDRVAARIGPGVVARTADGRPALDLRRGVVDALRSAGAVVVGDAQPCTACASRTLWSHRARGERGRQAGVVWIEP